MVQRRVVRSCLFCQLLRSRLTARYHRLKTSRRAACSQPWAPLQQARHSIEHHYCRITYLSGALDGGAGPAKAKPPRGPTPMARRRTAGALPLLLLLAAADWFVRAEAKPLSRSRRLQEVRARANARARAALVACTASAPPQAPMPTSIGCLPPSPPTFVAGRRRGLDLEQHIRELGGGPRPARAPRSEGGAERRRQRRKLPRAAAAAAGLHLDAQRHAAGAGGDLSGQRGAPEGRARAR